MEKGRELSLVNRLHKFDSSSIVAQREFGEAVDEIVEDWASMPPTVTVALKEALLKGAVVDSYRLAKVALCSQDSDYLSNKKIRGALAHHIDFWTSALRDGWPDPEIENTLLTLLTQSFARGLTSVGKVQMLEAIRDFGSVRSLQTLEMIDYDFFNKREVAKIKLDMLAVDGFSDRLGIEGIVEATEASAYVEIGRAIREAMSSVETRSRQPFPPKTGEEIQHAGDSISHSDHLDHDTDLALINRLSNAGESKSCEFKETFQFDISNKSKNKALAISALKAIAAFLNSEGGTLLIGVSDDGAMVGLMREIELFFKGSCDKFVNGFKDQIKTNFDAKFLPLIDWKIVEVAANTPVLVVKVKRSDKPCFLNNEFYVRTNPASDKLEGKDMLDYCEVRFPD